MTEIANMFFSILDELFNFVLQYVFGYIFVMV